MRFSSDFDIFLSAASKEAAQPCVAVPGTFPACPVLLLFAPLLQGLGNIPGFSDRRGVCGLHAGPPCNDCALRDSVRGFRPCGSDQGWTGRAAPGHSGQPHGNPAGLRSEGRGGAAVQSCVIIAIALPDGAQRELARPARDVRHDGAHRHPDGVLLVRSGAAGET